MIRQKDRMEILAHRGWWERPQDQNTLQCLGRALAAGHGIETDIRDRLGELVISHDPPDSDATVFSELLDMVGQNTSLLALNIKSDGLAPILASRNLSYSGKNIVFFDMSVPDMRGYLEHGLPVLTRHSDVEPTPAYYESAKGVWLDALVHPWATSKTIDQHLNADKIVAVVSEEIHNRSRDDQWELLYKFRNCDNVSLCTDLVEEAVSYFC